MAIQDLLGDVLFPPPPVGDITSFAFSTGAFFDAASEGAATIFQVTKAGNVRKVHWATRTVVTGATVDVRLETVDPATGFPSGSLVAANTNIGVVVANADDNTFFASTLTADAAVTAGQYLALVIANPAASFGQMTVCAAAFGYDLDLPYNALMQASWAKGISSFILMFALEYDDGSIVPITGVYPPATTIGLTNVSTASTPDVMGNRFQLTHAARAVGGWTWLDDDGDYDLKLVSTAYNQGAGTGILASVSKDKDIRRTGGGGIALSYFTAPVDLAAATNYRLIVEPTSATSLVFRDLNVSALALLDAFPGGRNIHLTSAKDPTGDVSWTNFNSGTFRRGMCGLILRGFDDASGATPGFAAVQRLVGSGLIG
jgi:hypothetical protein